MAVAAYASLLNLADSLARFQQLGDNGTILVDKQQVRDLQNQVRISLLFLEALPYQTLLTPQMEKLVGEIKVVGVEAELLVDGEIVGQLRGNGYWLEWPIIWGQTSKHNSWPILQSVIQKLELLIAGMNRELGSYMQNKVRFLLHSLGKAQYQTLRSQVDAFAEEVSIIAVEIRLLMDQFEDYSDWFLSFGNALQLLIQKLESLEKRRLMLVDREPGLGGSDVSLSGSIRVASSSVVNASEETVVPMGLEDKLKWIIDELKSHEKSLQVIPIVGMGGIGKTTLARKVFEDPKIKRRFDKRLWCTVSQDYDEKEILECLLEEKGNEESRELGGRLHQYLHSRRYLIVLDDMWSTNCWEYLKKFLPDNGNKSRVIVTTRMQQVADSLSSPRKQCVMPLLDDDSSWNLLQEKIFNGQKCPHVLEKIGRIIAENCKGLPISLVTIGGLLSKSDMTLEFWENFAENLKKMVVYGDCMKVLYLSYIYLPIHLKPCFLYFRNYREDSRISVHDMLQRWRCEGFVKPISGKHIEEVAEDCMKDLINRNLIMVTMTGSTGEILACGIHDLVRELCISESSKQDFLLIPRTCSLLPAGFCSLCRTNMPEIPSVFPFEEIPLKHVCGNCKMAYPHLSKSILLEFSIPEQHIQCVYPTTTRTANFIGCALFPILYLWNLQEVKIFMQSLDEQLVLPAEIWEMQQLRHLLADGLILPPLGKNLILLDKLYELHISDVKGFGEEVCKRISNLKKLHFSASLAESSSSGLHSLKLSGFRQLEVLELYYSHSCITSWSVVYPTSLKKLMFFSWEISVEVMAAIGSIPNLEILELTESYVAKEWRPARGQFIRLKVLHLELCGIELIGIESHHFPNLEKLVLIEMSNFEIPLNIGDISTLVSIHLSECQAPVVKSAVQLVQQQRHYGNDTLVLYLHDELLRVSDDDEDEDEDSAKEVV